VTSPRVKWFNTLFGLTTFCPADSVKGGLLFQGETMRLRGAFLVTSVMCGLPVLLLGQATNKTFEISGIVKDQAAAPLSSAELSLSRAGSNAKVFRTGDDGRFSFAGVLPGTVTVSVRRLGYKTASKTLDIGSESASQALDFELEEIASDIASVIVEASKGHLEEFYDHKANNNFGKFFEQSEIEKRHPFFLSELLHSVAGANLQASNRFGNRILLRDCKPMVWVDGSRAPGAELDEVARPGDVAGLEVYPSSAGLPPQYQERNNRMCGAIVVWTRNK
jgi:hypothetical protein